MRRLFIPLAAITCVIALADGPVNGKLYVTSPAATLVQQGLAAAAPNGADAQTFVKVPAPAIRTRENTAQSTTAPWIEANVWRFERGLKKVQYEKLPAGAAVLAAAETYPFGVEAILDPDPADVAELGKFLGFLKGQEQTQLPVMANIGVVDDKSPAMDEVLNMLTRRNLLYQVVAAPDRKLDINVQLGSKDFPAESAKNPSDFAAKVRAKLGDDKRLVRVYGTSTVIAHLTGDGKRARLYLLSYTRPGGGRGVPTAPRGNTPIRVRVLGKYQPVKFAAYGAAADAKLIDVDNPDNGTEFSVPTFNTLALVDLEVKK